MLARHKLAAGHDAGEAGTARLNHRVLLVDLLGAAILLAGLLLLLLAGL